MIVLLNYIVPVVTLILVYFGWKRKSGYPLAFAVALVLIYTAVQPSYMPKGTVKALPNTEFRTIDTPIVDRSLKPKSPEYYDDKRNEEIKKSSDNLEKQIERLQLKLKTSEE
jgi:hypothetical protein